MSYGVSKLVVFSSLMVRVFLFFNDVCYPIFQWCVLVNSSMVCATLKSCGPLVPSLMQPF